MSSPTEGPEGFASSPAPERFPPNAVLPVSLLVSSARLLLERHLGLVWVGGEISGFSRAASGHCYFNLKDDRAQVRCVLFRQKAQHLDFALADGLAVELRAVVSIYEARGEFQLSVEFVRRAGRGALHERFLQLKAKLEAAGWFAAGRKRALPAFPRAVGIVTSRKAAALRDVLTTLARRWPALRVIIYPCAVQGDAAPAEIARAIGIANARREVDALVVCRGGGSIEDLSAFNEEVVARAVFESALPVVSGVGHETDFTICDFVADLRAPTPTAAAALVAPDGAAIAHRVAQQATRLARAASHALAIRGQRLDAAARGLVHPAERLAEQRARVRDFADRLARAWERDAHGAEEAIAAGRVRLLREARAPLPQSARLHAAAAAWRRGAQDAMLRATLRLESIGRELAHLDPGAVLARGYAIVESADGGLVQDARQIAVGDELAIRLARGGAHARVTRTDG